MYSQAYYILCAFLLVSCHGSNWEANHSNFPGDDKQPIHPITEVDTSPQEITNSSFFLRELFNKYGHNGIMTVIQFEKMLENLGLRLVDEVFEEQIPDQDHHHTSDEDHHHTPDQDHQHTPDQDHQHTSDQDHRHTPDQDHHHTSDQDHHHTLDQDYHHTSDQNHHHTSDQDHLDTSDQISHEEGQTSPPDFDQNSVNLSLKAEQNISVTQVDELKYISTSGSISPDYFEDMNTTGLDLGMWSTDWNLGLWSTDWNLSLWSTDWSFGEMRTTDSSDVYPRVTHNSFGEKCLTAAEILNWHSIDSDDGSITQLDFYRLCPAILYQMDKTRCTRCIDQHYHHAPQHPEHHHLDYQVWLCATFSVLIISLCGLATVALIPVIQKSYYDALLQFLVSLAVGSLSGDALLHLLPHSMSSGHIQNAEKEDDSHGISVWHGLTALTGIIIFFSAERLLIIFKNHRKMKKNAEVTRGKVQHFVCPLTKVETEKNEVSQELSQHIYGQGDAVFEEREPVGVHETTAVPSRGHQKDSLHIISEVSTTVINLGQGQLSEENSVERNDDLSSTLTPSHGDGSFFLSDNYPEPVSLTEECHSEIVMHHSEQSCTDEHSHQGAPYSVSSVAWMVVIGDGLHNFCDGLAIGAAFGDGIPSGFSTAVAVFCHELPHELGDFAMLLKAGMSPKKALLYNSASSALCFVGMLIGVALGNISHASSWIFSMAGGMFLYIALVDMVPELSVNMTTKHHAFQQFLIQLGGIIFGAFIMLLIAVYEHDLQTIIR